MSLPVYVVGMAAQSVAHAVLDCEKVEHGVLICSDDLSYGRHLTDLWLRGDGFVLVEDDIAPWPGAVGGLSGCPWPWCKFGYCWGSGGVLGGTLGCWKVSADLTRQHPGLPERWRGVDWLHLDGAVTKALRVATPHGGFHAHSPPVAHAIHLRAPNWGA